ncbi:hypothetical protein AX16_006659 [Volvariella volvacea WC 439]|nr:hypothetical protein AX16_006659 [Volvariella volvacea WC 439]
MTRANGVSLDSVWLRLSPQEKEAITQQLSGYLGRLRSIPASQPPRIGSVTGRPVQCFRLHCQDRTGPFKDEEHLNRHLRGPGEDRYGFSPIVAQSHAKRHQLVLTHNDLYPRNIMVDGTRIMAIVDWEGAGWFPEHFEWCSIRNLAVGEEVDKDWRLWVDKFLELGRRNVRMLKLWTSGQFE